MESQKSDLVVQYRNVRILRNHQLVKEDLWTQNGRILDPIHRFYQLKKAADVQVDCKELIIAPGYIDIQINGGFGVDFSSVINDDTNGVQKVARNILSHGVTSFLPTVITSQPSTYQQVLPKIKPSKGGKNGAEILGTHLEGPFINVLKYGAHRKDFVQQQADNIQTLESTYGSLENVKIITLAPELPGMKDVIPELKKRRIVVSAD